MMEEMTMYNKLWKMTAVIVSLIPVLSNVAKNVYCETILKPIFY